MPIGLTVHGSTICTALWGPAGSKSAQATDFIALSMAHPIAMPRLAIKACFDYTLPGIREQGQLDA